MRVQSHWNFDCLVFAEWPTTLKWKNMPGFNSQICLLLTNEWAKGNKRKIIEFKDPKNIYSSHFHFYNSIAWVYFTNLVTWLVIYVTRQENQKKKWKKSQRSFLHSLHGLVLEVIGELKVEKNGRQEASFFYLRSMRWWSSNHSLSLEKWCHSWFVSLASSDLQTD